MARPSEVKARQTTLQTCSYFTVCQKSIKDNDVDRQQSENIASSRSHVRLFKTFTASEIDNFNNLHTGTSANTFTYLCKQVESSKRHARVIKTIKA